LHRFSCHTDQRADLFPIVANPGAREKFEYRASPISTARHDLPIGTTSTQTKELFMKMHLVMAAAFAGLLSHAAFASSEGGDTWSELQPQSVARSTQPLAIATTGSSTSPQSSSIPASEGGDTWSALQPQSVAGSARPPAIATSAPMTSPQGFPVPASEGGDTWSELHPQGAQNVRAFVTPDARYRGG
jgi:hypothetical protein